MSVPSVMKKQVGALLRRRGYEVRPVGDDAWLVARPGAGPSIEAVSPRIALVADHPRPKWLQRHMAHHLAHHEVNWVLERAGVNCVLDVGANRGQFAQALRASGYRGRIVSFEPVAEHVEVLRELTATDPDWLVLPYAAGEADATETINVVPGTMSSLLEASEFGKGWKQRLAQPHEEQIEVRRLDGCYAEAVAGLDDPRVFLKLDTQGYDLHAFRGLGSRAEGIVGLMSELACVPIYEGMPAFGDQLGEYTSAGFELSGMYAVSIDDASMRVIEFDAVLVRPEAVREGRRPRTSDH